MNHHPHRHHPKSNQGLVEEENISSVLFKSLDVFVWNETRRPFEHHTGFSTQHAFIKSKAFLDRSEAMRKKIQWRQNGLQSQNG